MYNTPRTQSRFNRRNRELRPHRSRVSRRHCRLLASSCSVNKLGISSVELVLYTFSSTEGISGLDSENHFTSARQLRGGRGHRSAREPLPFRILCLVLLHSVMRVTGLANRRQTVSRNRDSVNISPSVRYCVRVFLRPERRIHSWRYDRAIRFS